MSWGQQESAQNKIMDMSTTVLEKRGSYTWRSTGNKATFTFGYRGIYDISSVIKVIVVFPKIGWCPLMSPQKMTLLSISWKTLSNNVDDKLEETWIYTDLKLREFCYWLMLQCQPNRLSDNWNSLLSIYVHWDLSDLDSSNDYSIVAINLIRTY